MNSKKVFFGMIGLVVILASLNVAVLVVGNSMMSKKSAQLVGLKVDSEVLNNQQDALVKAQKDIAKYSDLDQIARTIVPQDKDQAKAVREIINLAGKSGVPIQSITFPTSNLGQAVPVGSAVKTPLTQVQPVTGLSGVFLMQINVQSDTNNTTTYNQLIKFLRGLEGNRRTAQVTSISISPDSSDRNRSSFSLVINLYVKP